MTTKTFNLAAFVENPDNPQTVTDESFAALVESVRTMPETLEANRIAFVTDYVALDGTDYHGKRVVIAGNKRLRALKEIEKRGGGIPSADGESWHMTPNGDVPADWFFDLTPLGEDARRKWLVKSNVQSGDWDAEKLLALFDRSELDALMDAKTLTDLLGELDTDGSDVSPLEEDTDDSNAEYQAFVDKFKPKLTTDDCYTPENIYNAVADWVAKTYNLDRACFVRPFWPGGDYENADYPPDCVVVDNPPFSIMAQILRFYSKRSIPFFLFAPALTLFAAHDTPGICYICTNASVTYENGARVSTSFVTSLGGGDIIAESRPDLYDIVTAVDTVNIKAQKKTVANIELPVCVATAAKLGWMAKHHVNFRIRRSDARYIRRLDEMEKSDSIYGGAFFLSTAAAAEKAAAEKAAATRWSLSEAEWEIVKSLG